MESFLVFSGFLLVPSTIGAINYLICRRIRPGLATVFSVFLLYFIVTFLYGAFGAGFIYFLLAAAVSKAGGWAHSKTVSKFHDETEQSRDFVMVATLFTLIEGIVLLIMLRTLVWRAVVGLSFVLVQLSGISYLFLLLTTPSMTAFLIWMWQSLTLRPGLDKHFED